MGTKDGKEEEREAQIIRGDEETRGSRRVLNVIDHIISLPQRYFPFMSSYFRADCNFQPYSQDISVYDGLLYCTYYSTALLLATGHEDHDFPCY